MDLERIKQNLRLRSGRSRKSKKQTTQKTTPQAPPAVNGTSTVPPQSKLTQPSPSSQAEQKQDSPKKSQEPTPDVTTNGAAHHPSGPANDSTEHQVGSKDAGTKERARYGRSGIELPYTDEDLKEQANQEQNMTEQRAMYASEGSGDERNFDFRPPSAKKTKPPSVESLSELLFSAGHLNTILHEPKSVARFTGFLSKYRPKYQPLIVRYLETQKAIKAVEYANAVAEGAPVEDDADGHVMEKKLPSSAAKLEDSFREASDKAFEALVGDALPMFITYCLVKLVSECLINEITGKQTPMMRNLVGGLSEVFCITDPTQHDNPIIYASEEFYRLTGYGRDDVIDHNCRFLQGLKTKKASVTRLRESTKKGDSLCEILLNYKRDGTPFINMLMIAPLHDDKGKVKYNIGAQVDVSGLVEAGRGLDTFERYLSLRQMEQLQKPANEDPESKRKQKQLDKLRELSEMFDLEESAVVQTSSRASSISRDSVRSMSSEGRRGGRRVFVDGDDSEGSDDDDGGEGQGDKDAWNLGQSGGTLPGIYDSYMLIRPAPSLRIIFVSPKLRRLGKVVQNPFLSHVAAPAVTLTGLKESFTTSTPVSAKINFMAQPGEFRDGTKINARAKNDDGKNGKTCWISATPMLGSDDRVGVWMVVVVEKGRARNMHRAAEVESKIAQGASTNDSVPANDSTPQQQQKKQNRPTSIELPKRSVMRGRSDAPEAAEEDLPIKPKRLLDGGEAEAEANAEVSKTENSEKSDAKQISSKISSNSQEKDDPASQAEKEDEPQEHTQQKNEGITLGEPGESKETSGTGRLHSGSDEEEKQQVGQADEPTEDNHQSGQEQVSKNEEEEEKEVVQTEQDKKPTTETQGTGEDDPVGAVENKHDDYTLGPAPLEQNAKPEGNAQSEHEHGLPDSGPSRDVDEPTNGDEEHNPWQPTKTQDDKADEDNGKDEPDPDYEESPQELEHRKYTPPPEIRPEMEGATPPPQTPMPEDMNVAAGGGGGVGGDGNGSGISDDRFDITPTRTRFSSHEQREKEKEKEKEDSLVGFGREVEDDNNDDRNDQGQEIAQAGMKSDDKAIADINEENNINVDADKGEEISREDFVEKTKSSTEVDSSANKFQNPTANTKTTIMMDYLAYPGSGSRRRELNQAEVAQMNERLGGIHEHGHHGHQAHGHDDDDGYISALGKRIVVARSDQWTDPDCMMSPGLYSVD